MQLLILCTETKSTSRSSMDKVLVARVGSGCEFPSPWPAAALEEARGREGEGWIGTGRRGNGLGRLRGVSRTRRWRRGSNCVARDVEVASAALAWPASSSVCPCLRKMTGEGRWAWAGGDELGLFAGK